VRRVSLDNIQSGVILAKTVMTLEGRVLLASGTVLTEEYKKKLIANGITEIYIEDEISKGIHIPEVVREEIVTEAKRKIKLMMTNPSIKTSIDGQQVMEIVDSIITSLLSDKDIVANLSDIRSVDDYTFSHSVNVCILSLIIGIGFGYSIDQLKELGVGSILHDIGKVMIPGEILKKPVQLNNKEFEEIKKHTVYGYELLKKNKGITTLASYISLEHHERMDGSGYPHKLKGDDINKAARIVAVSDVYDALTTDRVYRKKLMSHEVIDYITALGSHHFDQEVVDVFIRFIAYYPVGMGVILNTGERGIVKEYNKKYPVRPVVRVVADAAGNMLSKQKDVDLSSELKYRIVEIWDV